jgi:hypothetical protein
MESLDCKCCFTSPHLITVETTLYVVYLCEHNILSAGRVCCLGQQVPSSGLVPSSRQQTLHTENKGVLAEI